ncbi:MAG: hypothetical protein QXI64_10675 [Sulfolobales archaeon]
MKPMYGLENKGNWFMLRRGTVILVPKQPWYQGANVSEEPAGGERQKVVEMPKANIAGYVVGKLHGNSILRAHKNAVLGIINEVRKGEIEKIYSSDPLAAAILLATAPLLGLERNEKAREIAFKNEYLRLYGVGISSWLPQRMLSVTDAIPAYDYGLPQLSSRYNLAREHIERELGVKLPPPRTPPERINISKKYSRRAHLEEEYNKLGIKYLAPSYVLKKVEDAKDAKDPFRGMLIVREYVTDLQPLLSYVVISERGFLSDIQLGILVAGFSRMRSVGPSENLFDTYFVAEAINLANGEVTVVASGFDNDREESLLNEASKAFYNRFISWLNEADFAGSIIELARVLMEQARKEGKLAEAKKKGEG